MKLSKKVLNSTKLINKKTKIKNEINFKNNFLILFINKLFIFYCSS